jgi:hypothetical protein
MKHNVPNLPSRLISFYFALLVILLLMIAFLFGHLLFQKRNQVNPTSNALVPFRYLGDEALPRYEKAEEGHLPPDYESAAPQPAAIV